MIRAVSPAPAPAARAAAPVMRHGRPVTHDTKTAGPDECADPLPRATGVRVRTVPGGHAALRAVAPKVAHGRSVMARSDSGVTFEKYYDALR